MMSEAQLLQIISQYLAAEKPIIPDLNVIMTRCQQAIAGDRLDFDALIFALEEHRDVRANTVSIRTPEGVWIRDAREVNFNIQVVEPWENYAILGMSYLTTVVLFLSIYQYQNMDAALKDVRQIAQSFLQDWQQERNQTQPIPCTAALLVQAIKLLKDFLVVTESTAKKYIEVGKDFASLQSTPVPMVTITQRMKQPVTVEIERPLTAISPNLLNEYQQRDTKPWFTKLPDWQQRLVTFAIDSLAHGKMLSTQLRKYLPGPRNLYQRLLVQVNGQQQHCIMNLYHSGTPGHELKGEGESLRATQLTVEALYDAIGCNHLHLNMLISPITVRLKELRLDEQFNATIDNRHVHHITTPLNGFRRMVDNNLQQMSIVCEALGKSRARSEEGAWFLCIKHILQQTILHADSSESENPNLMIQGLFAYLLTLLRDPRDQASLIACLSGKDRTGVLLMHASGLAMSLSEIRRQYDQVIDLNKNPDIDLEQLCKEIKLTLESDDFTKSLRANFIQLIGSGHVILLAGAIGATRGCARLKIDSISAVPDSLLPLFKPCLFGRCAMFNKQGPTLSIPTRIRSVINPQSALAVEENDDDDDDEDNEMLDEEVAQPKWCLFK